MSDVARLALFIGAAALFVDCAGAQPTVGMPGAMAQSRAKKGGERPSSALIGLTVANSPGSRIRK
jgi:hypothetical protein